MTRYLTGSLSVKAIPQHIMPKRDEEQQRYVGLNEGISAQSLILERARQNVPCVFTRNALARKHS